MLLKFALIVAALLLAAERADAQDQMPAEAEAMCIDGKLVAIRLMVPAPGLITIAIPPDICDAPKPQPNPGKAPAGKPAKQV